MAEPGSNLFQIRRIFGFRDGAGGATQAPGAYIRSGASSSPPPWPPRAQIEAMAVHTLEKKQLLALAISPRGLSDTEGSGAGTTGGTGPLGGAKGNKGAARAADPTVGNYLLLRTIEEDRHARFWRFPVCSSLKQQRAGKTEKLVALEFSPEGDWLAALSSRKNRFHLIPVLALIARQRSAMLDATYRPAHNRELLSVHQSVMNVQMASYLRATNEFGGMNGARYHSQVAGDDEQMSTLEFAVGMGDITCLRWWRSFNGKNYCLVGGSESLVSIINVEENAEECRCELANAGVIEGIDLLRENFRRETRTSMLVKARDDDAVVRYYRVVLEKKFQPPPPQKSKAGKKRGEGNSNEASSDSEQPSGNKGIGAFALFAGAANIGANVGARAPKFVVKTFPEHFLQDLDFRPQRIKKNVPHVQLFAINGILSSESSLALYDCKQQKVNLYSNFHWSLKGVYDVPSLLSKDNEDLAEEREALEASGESANDDTASVQGGDDKEEDARRDGVADVELTYCSSDLMLLQGKDADTSATISAWVSLPSHQSLDDSVATAHIVHYLSLHGNEKVERVVQSTARNVGTATSASSRGAGGRVAAAASSNDSEVIYILQTRHNVYECRPQWSRVALFKALCAHSIALSNALSIGYALGIDMASLCQVAANTLYNSISQGKATADASLLSWMRDLFEVSRALPSTVIRQLTAVGGTAYAIEYAKHVLEKPPRGFDYDESERGRVAYLLVDLLLQPRLYIDGDTNGVASTRMSGDQDEFDNGEDADCAVDEHHEWLMRFLAINRDYDSSEVVELCLEHQRVDIAIAVGIQRQDAPAVLEKIVAAGLAPFVSTESIDRLLEADQGAALAAPGSRLILHALPLEVQVSVLLSHSPSVLQHRDWVARNMTAIPVDLCRRLASAIDPRAKANDNDKVVQEDDEDEGGEEDIAVEDTNDALLTDAVATTASPAIVARLAGVAASEFIRPAPEEQVELFLTALLRVNMRSEDDKSVDGSDQYSQTALESLMKELADRYRPPIMVARCVDYGNWSAAACIYEAHGELVEALECRLNAKRALRAVSPLSPPSSPTKTRSAPHNRRRRQFSIESDSLGAEEAERQDEMRQELLELLNSLVVQRHKQPEEGEALSSERLRAAILARLLVKWVESGLGRAELEVFLVSPNVYPHVASLLAAIFFSDVVAAVGGEALMSDDGGANADKPVAQFDDRDREWIDKCHALAFSGQFLFRVCMSFLEHSAAAKRSGVAAPLPAAINPQDSSATSSPTLNLLDLVKENIVSNDLAHTAVRIGPHSAQSLGKSDPLETHVKVFTCGHVFPKRVFEDEVVPEFEKRMNALPLPLLSTKLLFTREFRRSVVEAPCPVCSFNRISELVYEHLATDHQDENGGSSPAKRRTNAGLYFLHQSDSDRAVFSASSNMAGATRARQHERWEWREQKTERANRNAKEKTASAGVARAAAAKAP